LGFIAILGVSRRWEFKNNAPKKTSKTKIFSVFVYHVLGRFSAREVRKHHTGYRKTGLGPFLLSDPPIKQKHPEKLFPKTHMSKPPHQKAIKKNALSHTSIFFGRFIPSFCFLRFGAVLVKGSSKKSTTGQKNAIARQKRPTDIHCFFLVGTAREGVGLCTAAQGPQLRAGSRKPEPLLWSYQATRMYGVEGGAKLMQVLQTRCQVCRTTGARGSSRGPGCKSAQWTAWTGRGQPGAAVEQVRASNAGADAI
jgi:hypothetical protein